MWVARLRRASAKSVFLSILLLTLLFGRNDQATASTLFGSSGNVGSPPIYTIDQNSGAPTVLGSSGVTSLANMASDWRPESFRLWAVDDANNRLLRIDPTTGAGTVVGSFGAAHVMELAFDVITGDLYATDLSNIYRVDPASGATTLIGSMGGYSVYALGFDLEGTLFGVIFPENILARIDTSTGAASLVAPTGVAGLVDLACRPEDGTMFGVATIGSFSLFHIDTSTGAASLVGPYGLPDGINGLAFSPVPEPSTLAVAGLATALLILRRKS